MKLRNIKGFHGAREVGLTLTRPDGSHAGWTVIAGRNGSGKSTLLQAIAFTLSGPCVVFAFMQSFENWMTRGADAALTDLQITRDSEFDSFLGVPDQVARLALSWAGRFSENRFRSHARRPVEH